SPTSPTSVIVPDSHQLRHLRPAASGKRNGCTVAFSPDRDGRYVTDMAPLPRILDRATASFMSSVTSSNNRIPEPTTSGQMVRLSSSSSPSRSSDRISFGLPGTWIVLPGSAFTFASAEPSSPLSSVAGPHSSLPTLSGVLDTTYLR